MIREIRISPIWAVTMIEHQEDSYVRYFFTKKDERGQVSIMFEPKAFEWNFKNELKDEEALDIIIKEGVAL